MRMTAADYLASLAPPAKRKATPKKRAPGKISDLTGVVAAREAVWGEAYRSTLVVTARTNAHIHWRKRHATDQEDREHGKAIVRRYPDFIRKMLHPGGRIHVEFTRLSTATCDDDNLPSAFKAVRDGIAEAFGIDDGSDRYVWSYAQRRIKRGEAPGFEVVLWAERVK
jgi:hypothetical protein